MSIQLRQQQLIKLLDENGAMNVNDISQRLGVTGATVRSDLRRLEDRGVVQRFHGGARLVETDMNNDNKVECRKKRIARYAASLLNDGDSVLFDASSTVKYMVKYMRQLENMTLFTNAVSMARELVKNPSNQVILVGGRLQDDGDLVKGIRGFSIMDGLHVAKTFISCSGFSLENGLITFDVDEAIVMRERISIAREVIALVDSTKFGKEGVAPFASLKEVSMVITDDGIGNDWIKEIRSRGPELVVVDKQGNIKHFPASRGQFTIGFANLDTTSSFAADVQKGLERAAEQANLRLIVKNNQLNSEVALENVNELIEDGIDLMIEYHIDETIGAVIMDKLNRRHIPVIAVDIPMIGATYFGVDNYNAGLMAGEAMGEWIMNQWHGHFDRVFILEEPRSGSFPAARTYGQLDGVQKVLGKIPEVKRMRLNCGNRKDTSRAAVKNALEIYPEAHRIAVLGFNDDSAMGALEAARELGREQDVVIVGQDAAAVIRDEIRNPESRIIGSTACWPEHYGARLVKLAIKILNGEWVPNAVTMDHMFITHVNIENFYPQTSQKELVKAGEDSYS